MTASKKPSYRKTWATCETCGKRSYPTRSEARQAARAHSINADKFNVYRCGDGWHLGHLPQAVRSGELDKDEWLKRKEAHGDRSEQ
jgi:hypothetical protein